MHVVKQTTGDVEPTWCGGEAGAGSGRHGSFGINKEVQAARRCSSQMVAPSAAAVRATKMPASMNWKGQNRSAG
jgi:hypothetical protein